MVYNDSYFNFRLARCLFSCPAATFLFKNAKHGGVRKTARVQASSNASENCQGISRLLCALVEGLAKTNNSGHCHNLLWKVRSRQGLHLISDFLVIFHFLKKSKNLIKGSKLRDFQKIAMNDHSWTALDYSRKTQTYLVLSRKVQQCPLERMAVFDEVRLSRFPSG